MIKGIHHVSMRTNSLEEYEKALAFYCDVLGMKIAREWHRGAQIDTGCGLIEIFKDTEGTFDSGAVEHFALATNHVDACIERIREAGYQVTVEPKDVVLDSEPELPIRIAFFRGPLGELVELFAER
jgi:glyoxylase I family protein